MGLSELGDSRSVRRAQPRLILARTGLAATSAVVAANTYKRAETDTRMVSVFFSWVEKDGDGGERGGERGRRT